MESIEVASSAAGVDDEADRNHVMSDYRLNTHVEFNGNG